MPIVDERGGFLVGTRSRQDAEQTGCCQPEQPEVQSPQAMESAGCGVIQACVAQEMHRYLTTLRGHDGVDLYRMVIEQVEPALFSAVLAYCNGNQTRAAQMLGINRATLRKKLIHYSLIR